MRQVFSFLQRRWLIIILALIVLTLISWWLYTRNKSAPLPQPTPIPATQNLEPAQILPPPNTKALGTDTTNAIIIDFLVPIDLTTVRTSVIPSTILIPGYNLQDNTALILQPATPWQTGDYTIVLHKGLRSIDQLYELQQDLIINYTVVPPQRPIYNRPS
jgi:hypothetical protein